MIDVFSFVFSSPRSSMENSQPTMPKKHQKIGQVENVALFSHTIKMIKSENVGKLMGMLFKTRLLCIRDCYILGVNFRSAYTKVAVKNFVFQFTGCVIHAWASKGG